MSKSINLNITLTETDCKKWFGNKLVNPITNKGIQKGKSTYNAIEEQCSKLVPKKKIKGFEETFTVPRHPKEWSEDPFTSKYLKNIMYIFEKYGIVGENDHKNFKAFAKLLDTCLKDNVVPEHLIDQALKQKQIL